MFLQRLFLVSLLRLRLKDVRLFQQQFVNISSKSQIKLLS